MLFLLYVVFFFFFKQKTAYEMRISDWSSDVCSSDLVGFALVWKAPAEFLKQFPNLKAICSLGQGVDHIFADPELPRGPHILRLVDPWMGRAMAEWFLLQEIGRAHV